MRIALFITCLTDSFLPRPGLAVARVLQHLGHEVIYPEGQTCCGQAMFNNGFHGDARRLALRMARVFEEYEWVVTNSASCAAMVREHIPQLLVGSKEEKELADALSSKTFEFIEFLQRVLELEPRDLQIPWQAIGTYHPSCHLRTLGADACEAYLGEVRGLDFRAMDKASECCGFGGTFALKYPKISASMLQEKLASIERSGADTLVSNDPGCSLNLLGACHRRGLPVRTLSYAEILAEGLGLLEADETGHDC
ncbi:MAG: (Fe-S)-binding protein [Planctomycetota bacterium]|jgi:L-lactate dehydrogenase complex protein LldE